MTLADCNKEVSVQATSDPSNPSKILEATVKEEFGTASLLADGSGIVPEKLNYGLVLEAPDGTYFLDVDEEYKQRSLLSLAKQLQKGDKVRIVYDNSGCFGSSHAPCIRDAKTGYVFTHYVEIINTK